MSGRRRARSGFLVTLTLLALFPVACSGGGATAAPSASQALATGLAPTPTAAPTANATAISTASPTPVPGPAQWVAAGAIDPGRALTHAVLLTDGDLLVVGEEWLGCGGEGLSALETSVDSEVYLAATGTWHKTASLNAVRVGLVAVPLTDGRALVTGGQTADGIPFSSAKLFDPVAGMWSQPGLMGYARTDAAGATLKDGRVLVTGGWFPSWTVTPRMVPSSEIFDPSTGKWSGTGSLHTLRDRAQDVTLSDGRVLVVGGETDLAGTVTRTAELWDPSTGAWSSAGTLAPGRSSRSPDFALVALTDGSALVVGGTSSAATGAEHFDPVTLTWSSTGTMMTAASARAVALLADGRVLAAGGLGASGPTTAAELFDPATGTWTATVPLPTARAGAVAAVLADGSVLLVGGYSGINLPARGATGGGSGCPIAVADALRYILAVP